MTMGKLTNRRAPSVSALMDLKDVDKETAELIRGAWIRNDRRSDCREKVDTLFKSFGVEHLGIHRRTGLHVYYCNAGDTYATTLIFHGDNMRIACWGDLVEKNLIREENNPY